METNDRNIRGYVALAIVTGATVYGCYQLVKLGGAWITAGVIAYQDKKALKK